MIVVGLDPGPESCGMVAYNAQGSILFSGSAYTIADVQASLCRSLYRDAPVAIEMVSCYGMAVGRSVFETCVTVGKLEAVRGDIVRIERPEAKMFLCNSRAAKDKNIRQALIDKFAPAGGGKCPQLGTKKQPGPLYGMASHAWAALAIAYTMAHSQGRLGLPEPTTKN